MSGSPPVTAFRASAAIASVCAAFALLLAAGAAQKDRARDALWELVHNECVPDQSQSHDPGACVQVDLSKGMENGFAILKDPMGATQVLLISTARISGIESPILLSPNAANYFADAWEARTYIDKALHQTLPRDDIGLAINSAASRTQDQLHIHVDCIRADVREALHQHEASIGNSWAPLNVFLSGRRYMAMWVSGEQLGSNNPFKLLADGVPGAVQDMGNRTLAVIGSTRANGAVGFVILEDEVNRQSGDLAIGEELLDHTCRVAATEMREN
jgi:CDP-diacylglycerol pyrophosphatase